MNATLRNFVFTAIAAGIIGLCLPQTASADQHEIKYRQGVMKSVGGTMGSLAAILKKQAPAGHAVSLAKNMGNLANVVPDVFPDGSDFGETAALPVIWEKPAEFKAAVDAFVLAAKRMPDAAAAGGEAFGQAFLELAKACKGCHENFREKKEQ